MIDLSNERVNRFNRKVERRLKRQVLECGFCSESVVEFDASFFDVTSRAYVRPSAAWRELELKLSERGRNFTAFPQMDV